MTVRAFGPTIRHARRAKGLSQAATAALIQTLSQDQLSRIETGKRGLSASEWLDLSTLLGIETDTSLCPYCSRPKLTPATPSIVEG
jgi:transcriptional regulator with XRE-family HTH domain